MEIIIYVDLAMTILDLELAAIINRITYSKQITFANIFETKAGGVPPVKLTAI